MVTAIEPGLEPLSAPIELSFDYTRSLGPTLSPFLTALRDQRVIGSVGSDGRVYVPPAEFDPVTAAALTRFVDVADTGEVVSWSWCAEPQPSQPLTRPFAWVLVRLDGADTPILHALDVAGPDEVRIGQRVRVRWAGETVGSITDIACFEPDDGGARPVTGAASAAGPVEMTITPIRLSVQHSASVEETHYLHALKAGKLVGQRCPKCSKVYIPPRSACPVDGVPPAEYVELADHGTITTFCIVNVPFPGQRLKPPYVAAYVLLDGADIAFLHVIHGCDPAEVRMGLRVRAHWRPPEEWDFTLRNVEYFEPTGEPDADFETYREHL